MANDTIGRVEGQLIGIIETLGHMNKALFGNGQPGAMERLTRIEENLERVSVENEKCNQAQSASIDRISKAVSDLTKLVDTHVEDRSKHVLINMTMNKRTAMFIIGCFAVMQIIYLEAPAAWAFILHTVGL